jgi:hypothetical protein
MSTIAGTGEASGAAELSASTLIIAEVVEAVALLRATPLPDLVTRTRAHSSLIQRPREDGDEEAVTAPWPVLQCCSHPVAGRPEVLAALAPALEAGCAYAFHRGELPLCTVVRALTGYHWGVRHVNAYTQLVVAPCDATWVSRHPATCVGDDTLHPDWGLLIGHMVELTLRLTRRDRWRTHTWPIHGLVLGLAAAAWTRRRPPILAIWAVGDREVGS